MKVSYPATQVLVTVKREHEILINRAFAEPVFGVYILAFSFEF